MYVDLQASCVCLLAALSESSSAWRVMNLQIELRYALKFCFIFNLLAAVFRCSLKYLHYHTQATRLSGGGLTGLQINRGSLSPPPPLTRMSDKEFVHSLWMALGLIFYDSSMLGWGCAEWQTDVSRLNSNIKKKKSSTKKQRNINRLF
jgi:hypothetical protein